MDDHGDDDDGFVEDDERMCNEAADDGDDVAQPGEIDTFARVDTIDAADAKYGFARYGDGPERLGWLVNMHATIVRDAKWAGGLAAVDYYFLQENGERFK